MNDVTKLPNWYPPEALEQAKGRIKGWGHSLKEHAYLIGRELIWIKAQVGHGGFGPWLNANVWFSERTAQRFIAFAQQCRREKKLLEYKPGKNDMVSDFALLELVDAERLIKLSQAYDLLAEWENNPGEEVIKARQFNDRLQAITSEIAGCEAELKEAHTVAELESVHDRVTRLGNEALEIKLLAAYALGKILNSVSKPQGLAELVNLPEPVRRKLFVERIAELL